MDFSTHLNRGTHMVTSLYNIPSRYLGSYNKIFHCFGITLTHLQNIPMPLLSQFLVSNLAHNFFHHFPELPQKSQHFWTFPNLTSYSNHLNLNQMSLNLIFQSCLFLFFLVRAYFCESKEIIPLRIFFP